MTEYLFMTETYPIINQIQATLPCPGRAHPLCWGSPPTGHGTVAGAGCLYWQVENSQHERQGQGPFGCVFVQQPWFSLVLVHLGEDNLGVSSEGC